MADTRRAASDLVDAIVDNMRSNLEPLKYTTLAASRYTVYLSAAEYARLEGILPRLHAEAVRALDDELRKLNRPSFLRRHVSWWPIGQGRPFQNADVHWHIEFLCDPDGELANEGDIVVHSDLMLPASPELGVGELTRRITTVRAGTEATKTERTVATRPPAPQATAYAKLSFDDNRGRQEHTIVADSTSIGRGGLAYPVDIRIVTTEDVSREHARIRRDPQTGHFFLIDLSTLGTTLNGRHIPKGFEDREGTRRENNVRTQLPDRARIGLADTVFLDFERTSS